MAFPHAMLRCGYPYERVMGMRRVTTFPVDVAIGDDRIYVVGRTELGVGGNIRMVSLKTDDELGDDLTHGDLGTMADTGHLWPVGLLRTDDGNLHVLDEGNHNVTTYSPDGEKLNQWGRTRLGTGTTRPAVGLRVRLGRQRLGGRHANHRIQQSRLRVSTSAASASSATVLDSSTCPGASPLTPKATCTSPTGATTGCRS